ncbi:hypothetical protein MJ749_25230 [Paenibacillus polymyxa]|uniref:hypothetical protein n=1 Tax=Paenibacillus polymyxa TaxID=1406 RepID=UPI001F0FA09E|nr:hypothetical protein [Paenibacillus polymyxa]UMR35886.1 hypothetical protein MJ749_25230 [Paenibacillus polymyxa]
MRFSNVLTGNVYTVYTVHLRTCPLNVDGARDSGDLHNDMITDQLGTGIHVAVYLPGTWVCASECPIYK